MVIDLLSFMSCFPISDYVMLLEGIVSFKSSARANARITYEKNKRKIPMRTSRGLKWENKTYKLKRSIPRAAFLVRDQYHRSVLFVRPNLI